MRPEPLKGKMRYLGTGQTADDMIFKIRHVQSAIEWLKQEFMKRAYNKKTWLIEMPPALMRELIDEAFEDVKNGERFDQPVARSDGEK